MGIFIIAEAGVNHNGSLELAKELVDAAKEAGADCIKFQTYITEELVSQEAPKAQYQIANTKNDESQYVMLKKLELTYKDFCKLKIYCAKKNILFLSTPFDLQSIEFLKKLDMPFWKIPSGEITNLPYLEKIAATEMPVIMSTGMCTLKEISQALGVLAPSGCGKTTLLHCTTEYPAPFQSVNLKALQTLAQYFHLPVGYSDHTPGIEIALAAAAIGAVVIEKHFTLNKKMEGPDHAASLDPCEFKAMVSAIRHIEAAMGDGSKHPTAFENSNRLLVRKSIVARTSISIGDMFTQDNLTVKRPGTGISPMLWHTLLGSKANKNYQPDDLIEW